MGPTTLFLNSFCPLYIFDFLSTSTVTLKRGVQTRRFNQWRTLYWRPVIGLQDNNV